MRAPRSWHLLRIALAGAALAACRQIGGVDELKFDLAPGAFDEVCTNGLDDDGDGRADCEDPACASAGFACTAPIPDGWTGPVVIFEGPPDAEPPCPAAYPDRVRLGAVDFDAAPAACSPCTCGAPDVTCALPEIRAFDKSTCVGAWTSFNVVDGECTPLQGAFQSFRREVATSGAASCAPAGGTPEVPAIAWKTIGVVCAAEPGGGCAAGAVCAPAPEAPFAPSRCIEREGANACPAAFPAKHLLGDVADERTCGACACSELPPITCDVTTTLFADGLCQSALATLPEAQCAPEAGAAAVVSTATIPGSPSCAPSGGQPIGAVVLAAPITVCCAD